jgi:3-oxoacyl-[acyl-carrier-protein] synthase-3
LFVFDKRLCIKKMNERFSAPFFSRKPNGLRPKKAIKRIGLKGSGYSVPDHIRYNNDPIFAQITTASNAQGISEKDLFTGMKERRYLDGDEQLEPLMVEAAQTALVRAGLEPLDIDRLYGYASVSAYLTPNALYAVHYELGLPEHALVVAINSEFSNFLLGVLQACEAIAVGNSINALVVCGTNWTRYMDYTQGHSLSVGDGAGAAVVCANADFVLVDYVTQTVSEQYGAMAMKMRYITLNGRRHVLVDGQGLPIPSYEITELAGIHSFQETAMYGLPNMVQSLLEKHGLTGKHITLITHQASRVLMDQWAEMLQPEAYLDTLEQFGNLTVASYPVNFAYHYTNIKTEYLVFAAVGVGYHQTALLFKR